MRFKRIMLMTASIRVLRFTVPVMIVMVLMPTRPVFGRIFRITVAISITMTFIILRHPWLNRTNGQEEV